MSYLTGEQMEGMGMIVFRAESMEIAQCLADAGIGQFVRRALLYPQTLDDQRR